MKIFSNNCKISSHVKGDSNVHLPAFVSDEVNEDFLFMNIEPKGHSS